MEIQKVEDPSKLRTNYFLRLFLNTEKRKSAEKIVARFCKTEKIPDHCKIEYGIYYKDEKYLCCLSFYKDNLNTAESVLEASIFFSSLTYRYSTGGPHIRYEFKGKEVAPYDMEFDTFSKANEFLSVVGILDANMLVRAELICEDPT